MAAETAVQDDLTPAERRRLKVRDAIIGAAEEIFAEEGEAGLSMRRIAERIDYSPAALYKYFDSKEALFQEIREGFFERLYRRMQSVSREVETGPLLCTQCMRAYVETGLEQPAHYKLAFSGIADDEEHDKGTYAFAAAGHLKAMIEQSIAEGWFRPVDVQIAATSVWAASHGLTLLAITVPDFPTDIPGLSEPGENPPADMKSVVRHALDDLIDFHAAMVMRGLGTTRLIERLDGGDAF
jgi:AcrR family transcriptional regulator